MVDEHAVLAARWAELTGAEGDCEPDAVEFVGTPGPLLPSVFRIETVRRARRDGGSWQADITLAGVARWLDGLGRHEPDVAASVAEPGLDDVADLLATMRTGAGDLRYVRPPGSIGPAAPLWESPTPFPLPDLR